MRACTRVASARNRALRLSSALISLYGIQVLFAADDPSYVRDVRSILNRNCVGCHQPASKSSGLDLTTYRGLKDGGKRGPAIVEGSPEQSLAIKFMTGAIKPSMPLGGELLTPSDVETIERWIKAGARDDSPVETGAIGSTIYDQPPVIAALRFSPDGKLLAVGGNREILLHQADGSKLVARLPGKAERILSIEFSQDGTVMVAGGGTPARFGELQFWDVARGRCYPCTRRRPFFHRARAMRRTEYRS